MVLAAIEGGLAFALFGALTLLVLIAIAYVVTHGDGAGVSPYEQIGAGGLTSEADFDAPARAGSPAAADEREREIRQLLRARSERLARAGEEPLDIEAELARLLAAEEPSHGERSGSHAHGESPARRELLAEVRQLVLARNERLVRQGREPLDIDAEVARTLAELEPRPGRADG